MMITRGVGIRDGLAMEARSRLSLGASAVLMLVEVLRLCLRASLSRYTESENEKETCKMALPYLHSSDALVKAFGLLDLVLMHL